MALRRLLERLDRAGRLLEDGLLVAILGGMILLAAGQILARNVLDTGVFRGDELLRLMVLWVAVAGAVAASRSDKHINVAVLDRFLPPGPLAAVRTLVHLFTAVVCGAVTWYSAGFVQSSWEYGDTLLGDVPAWWLQSIVPAGFALITWRYARHAAGSLRALPRTRYRS